MLSFSLHEFAHGYVAYKQGDPTAKMAGRLTLNPLAHIDAFGFVMFLALGVGWAKPVPINPSNFKKYRSGIAKVSIAGPVVNLILCVIGSFVYCLLLSKVGDGYDIGVLIAFWVMLTNAYLFIFNLIPIYPLDGFNFVSSFMRSNNKFVQWNVKNAGRVFMWVIVIDLFTDLIFNISIISLFLAKFAGWICGPLCQLWQSIL
jgi:Zn-dependent protease